MTDLDAFIDDAFRTASERLEEHLSAWLNAHRIAPRQVTLHQSSVGPKTISVWLVTDHTGEDDSSYRIVFDPETREFGFELTMSDGRERFVGRCGSLEETVNAL